jgi:hypothetical protein
VADATPPLAGNVGLVPLLQVPEVSVKIIGKLLPEVRSTFPTATQLPAEPHEIE